MDHLAGKQEAFKKGQKECKTMAEVSQGKEALMKILMYVCECGLVKHHRNWESVDDNWWRAVRFIYEVEIRQMLCSKCEVRNG